MTHQHVPTGPRRARSPPPPPRAHSFSSSSDDEPDDKPRRGRRIPSWEKPRIPPLRSTAASIFVPLTDDLAGHVPAPSSTPDPPPPDRVSELEAVIAELEAHALQVGANIRALVRRECARILEDAAADEARFAPSAIPPPRAVQGHYHHQQQQQQQHPSHPVCPLRAPGKLAVADRAAMIANMEASDVDMLPEVLPLPDFSKYREPTNPTEWAAKEIMAAVSRALGELKGFHAHAAQVKQPLQRALEEEKDKAERQYLPMPSQPLSGHLASRPATHHAP